VSQPGVTQPGVSQPSLTQPSVTQPGVSQPSLTQPGGRRPGTRSSRPALHLALVAGLTVSAVGTWVEWRRALGGNRLSWAYAVEWPLIGAWTVWLWWRLRDEPDGDEPDGGPAAGRGPAPAGRRRLPGLPPGWGHRPAAAGAIPDDDPGLRAWQAYLRELRTAQPPGGPPTTSSP